MSTVAGTNGNDTPSREGAVIFNNLLGTGAITSSIISGGIEDNFRAENSTGTLSAFPISNSIIRNNDNVQNGVCPSGCGNIGVGFFATSTANMTATVSNNTLQGNRTESIRGDAGDSSHLTMTITSNTIIRGTAPNAAGNIGINVTTGVGGVGNYTVTNNKIGTDGVTDQPLLNTGINVFAGGTSTNTLTASVKNNTIVKDNLSSDPNGGASGTGVRVFQQDSAKMFVRVEGNSISKVGLDFGIDVTDNGNVNGSTGAVNVAVVNNNASVKNTAINAIRVRGRRDTNTCASITGNTATTNGGGAAMSISQSNQTSPNPALTAIFRFEIVPPPSLGALTDAQAQTELGDLNPSGGGFEAFSTTGSGITGVAAGTCSGIPQ